MSCAGEVDLNIPDNAVSIIYGKKGGKKANNENGNVNQFS
jgi:hypothetical protein